MRIELKIEISMGYIAIWENLTQKWILKKDKQGLMGFSELKTKSGLRELILEQIPFLEKKRGEKGEES